MVSLTNIDQNNIDIKRDSQANDLYKWEFHFKVPFVPATRRSLTYKAFKPLVQLGKNAAQYTQPYRSLSQILTDLAQPLFGILNIAKGALTIALSPIFSCIQFDLRFAKKSYAEMLGFNLVSGASMFFQGMVKLASTPIIYAIKIPLRGLVLTPLNSLFNFLTTTREKRQQKIVEEQLKNKYIHSRNMLHAVDSENNVNIAGKDSMTVILSFLEPKDLPKSALISTEFYLTQKEHVDVNNINVPTPLREFYTIGECLVTISSLKYSHGMRDKIPVHELNFPEHEEKIPEHELNNVTTLFQKEYIKLFKTEIEAIEYARKLTLNSAGRIYIPPVCKVTYLRNDIYPDTKMKILSTGEKYFERPKKDVVVIERRPVTPPYYGEYILNEDKDKFIRTRY